MKVPQQQGAATASKAQAHSAPSQSRSLGKEDTDTSEFQDLRPEAIAQRQLRDAIKAQGNPPTQLQSNSMQPIQLFNGAAETAQAGAQIDIELDDDTFVTKHVAADAGEAVTKTEARIAGDAPQSMKDGNLANSLSTEANWLAAMNADTTVIPDADEWGGDYGTDDDTGYARDLGPLTVQGWEAQGTAGNVAATATPITKNVAGTWTVENPEAEEGAEAAAPDVSIVIDHLTNV